MRPRPQSWLLSRSACARGMNSEDLAAPLQGAEYDPYKRGLSGFWATANRHVPIGGDRTAQVSRERSPDSAADIRRPGGLKPTSNILSASVKKFTKRART